MIDRTFTALFPFAGLGGGALGFRNADVRMLGRTGRFRILGGIDFDAPACACGQTVTSNHSTRCAKCQKRWRSGGYQKQRRAGAK